MKKQLVSLSVILVISLVFFVSCGQKKQDETDGPVIALSKAYETYSTWLLTADSTVEFVNLYGMPVADVASKLSEVDGVVVTGGEDIHPQWYGRAEDTVLCNTINLYRDSLDAAIIRYAAKENIPLLGICRGMQMLNVTLGGSLYADMSKQLGGDVAHRKPEFSDTLHKVTINQASLLHLIGEEHHAVVVSNHHQGVRDLAPVLRKVAESQDNLTEALEWKAPAGKGFLLGVQFHPERNKSQLSFALSEYFVQEVKRSSKNSAVQKE